MKRVFFGHRGVGKTSLLMRHQQYFSDVPHFDLDREIEKRSHRSVSEIFSESGEVEFRRIEKSVFDELIGLEKFVIALGGGFNPEQIPKQIEKVYVRRWTDHKGRVFTDRPRLNPDMSPLAEFVQRYHEREPRFLKCADWIYDLPEGEWLNPDIEKEIFKDGILKLAPYVTLDSAHMSLMNKFARLELRSDLFSESEVQQVLQSSSPEHEFLLSIRNEAGKAWLTSPWLSEWGTRAGHRLESVHQRHQPRIDWALELGNPEPSLLNKISVLSWHDGSIAEQIKHAERFEKTHVFFKLCPVVHSFAELVMGYEWQKQDPQRRSFLPRSSDTEESVHERASEHHEPRWRWFREFMLGKQPIQFCSQFQSVADQVSVYNSLVSMRSLQTTSIFGAVLGDPVLHSWTPLHHQAQIAMPWFAIPIEKGQLQESLFELQRLGLRCAAVTSPLKDEASELTGIAGCNSLVWTQSGWVGCNTDILALQSVLTAVVGAQQISSDVSVVFYGGGGVLPEIRNRYPEIQFYSAQTSKPRPGSIDILNPRLVIWAAPRKEGILLPNRNWRPQKIYDLNYGDDSMARDWFQALMTEATKNNSLQNNAPELFSAEHSSQLELAIRPVEYQSGAEFFKLQAKHQVEFFKKELNYVC